MCGGSVKDMLFLGGDASLKLLFNEQITRLCSLIEMTEMLHTFLVAMGSTWQPLGSCHKEASLGCSSC